MTNPLGCAFRSVTWLPETTCGASVAIVDDDGFRLCEDHAVTMYPDIEGQGWPTAAVLAKRADKRRFSTTIF